MSKLDGTNSFWSLVMVDSYSSFFFLFIYLVFFLFSNGERPECIILCNSNYSLKLILMDLVIDDVHQNFYDVNILSDLFTKVAGDTILKCLKEIN